MSPENVERLERFYEAFNSGDDLESLRAFVDPHFVYRTRNEFPGGGSYDFEGALERISELRIVFDEIRWEPQEVVDLGDRTLVVVRQIARGRTSGASVDQSIAHLWQTGSDGKARELCVYSRRSDALQAAGLSK